MGDSGVVDAVGCNREALFVLSPHLPFLKRIFIFPHTFHPCSFANCSHACRTRHRQPTPRTSPTPPQQTHLRRLPHLGPDDLPLVRLVVLDGLQQGRALSTHATPSASPEHGSEAGRKGEADEAADLVFRELGVVHVLRRPTPQRGGGSLARLVEVIPFELGRRGRRTLYQCFFTLPSVRAGKVLAISLHELPASRRALRRCSSAGVHGVLVRPFLATGLGSCGVGGGCWCWCWPVS